MSAGNFDPFGEMMGAAQTAVYSEPLAGSPGQITNIADQPISIISYPVEEDIIAGNAVSKKTIITETAGKYFSQNAPYTIAPLAEGASASDVLGLAVAAGNNHRLVANGLPGKRHGSVHSVMKKGYMFVQLYQDTVADAAAFVIVSATNSLNAPLGAIVASDPGTGAAVALPGVTWYASYTASIAGVGVVKVDL